MARAHGIGRELTAVLDEDQVWLRVRWFGHPDATLVPVTSVTCRERPAHRTPACQFVTRAPRSPGFERIPSWPDLTGIDSARVKELQASENERFRAERPRSMAYLKQARNTMPRGVPMSWMDDLYAYPPVWVTHGDGAYFSAHAETSPRTRLPCPGSHRRSRTPSPCRWRCGRHGCSDR